MNKKKVRLNNKKEELRKKKQPLRYDERNDMIISNLKPNTEMVDDIQYGPDFAKKIKVKKNKGPVL